MVYVICHNFGYDFIHVFINSVNLISVFFVF